jgi:glycosyltransferase involved in cell wall biosynthesis
MALISAPRSAARILFFVPDCDAGSDPVYHSQVWAMAGFLQTRGYACLVAGSERTGARAEQAERDLRERFGVETRVVPRPTEAQGWRVTRRAAKLVAQTLAPVIGAFGPTRIYYRSFAISGTVEGLARTMGAQTLFDLRGAIAEESELRRGTSFQAWIIRHMVRSAVRRAGRVACVSKNLKAYIAERTGRGDAIVIPCCVEAATFGFDAAARTRIRSEFGFGADHIVICYAGGSAVWQRTEDILRLCAEITKRDPRFRFLFLTYKPESLKQSFTDLVGRGDRAAFLSVPQAQVASYLSAADAGIIMRHDNLVNNVASPVKIAEYLICGLPVVLTAGIGDYSGEVPNAGAGMVLDGGGDMAGQVVRFLDAHDLGKLRENAISFARRHLTRESYIAEYEQCFGPPGAALTATSFTARADCSLT